MARAQKHTRTETRTVTDEIVTYTLELSAEEREALFNLLAGTANTGPIIDNVLIAMASPPDPAPQPLRVGDRVRVLREYPERQGRDIVQPAEYMVECGTPDEDNEIVVNGPGNAPYYYLAADGEGTIWERAS